MARPTGVCPLCGKNGELAESHILPKWTIRRALAGSVTGKLREGDNVNKRVQDGEKLFLLCDECEGKLSKLEGAATKAFDGGNVTYGSAYDKDFALFLTSIVWRIGIVRAAEFCGAYPSFMPAFDEAMQTWKDILDGKRSDFDGHPVWFVLLDPDLARSVHQLMQRESTDGRGASPAINRYFANYIGTEVTVYESEGYALIWGKTGSWLIVGMVTAPADPGSASVEVSLSGGTLPPAGHEVPGVVLANAGHESWRYIEQAAGVSTQQRQKIKDEWVKDADKVAVSDQRRAMQADLDLFGDAAFVNVPDPG